MYKKHRGDEIMEEAFGIPEPEPRVRDPEQWNEYRKEVWAVLLAHVPTAIRAALWELMQGIYQQRDHCPYNEGICDHSVCGVLIDGGILYVCRELLETGRWALAGILLDTTVSTLSEKLNVTDELFWEAFDQVLPAAEQVLMKYAKKAGNDTPPN